MRICKLKRVGHIQVMDPSVHRMCKLVAHSEHNYDIASEVLFTVLTPRFPFDYMGWLDISQFILGTPARSRGINHTSQPWNVSAWDPHLVLASEEATSIKTGNRRRNKVMSSFTGNAAAGRGGWPVKGGQDKVNDGGNHTRCGQHVEG